MHEIIEDNSDLSFTVFKMNKVKSFFKKNVYYIQFCIKIIFSVCILCEQGTH